MGANTDDFRFTAPSCLALRNRFGRINREVSYQLDHAPILFHLNMQARTYCMRVSIGSSTDRSNRGIAVPSLSFL
jgi:hypothetical protein